MDREDTRQQVVRRLVRQLPWLPFSQAADSGIAIVFLAVVKPF
jgi:hypothetical protein